MANPSPASLAALPAGIELVRQGVTLRAASEALIRPLDGETPGRLASRRQSFVELLSRRCKREGVAVRPVGNPWPGRPGERVRPGKLVPR